MVKTEPNIIRGRFVEFVWIGYIVFGTFYAFTNQPAYGNRFVTVLGYVFIGLFSVATGIAQVRFWRKQDQRRQQAANGDQNLIAEQQPPANGTTLSLPVTIVQRTAKGWLIMLAIAIVLLLVFLVAFLVFEILQKPSFTEVIYSLLLFVIVPAAFILYVVVPLLRGNQTLTVDEHGVRVRIGFGCTHSVGWNEAKLFAISAIYKQPYGITSEIRQFPTYYELSTEREVVRWRWVRTRNFIAIEPSLPIAEYDRQMQALLSLIVAKTGLTLCDMRPREQRL